MSFLDAYSLYCHLDFVNDLQTLLLVDGSFVRLLISKIFLFLVGLGSVNAQMEEDPFFHEGRAL